MTSSYDKVRAKANQDSLQVAIFIAFGTSLMFIGLSVAIKTYAENPSLESFCLGFGAGILVASAFLQFYKNQLAKRDFIDPLEDLVSNSESILRDACQRLINESKNQLVLFKENLDSGLLYVADTRRQGLEVLKEYIEKEKDEISIVCSSFAGILNENAEIYRELKRIIPLKVKDGVKIKVLMTHPLFADFRSEQESTNREKIGGEIVDGIKILIDDFKINPSDVKLYSGTPTCFAIKTSEAMLINPYPYRSKAFEMPTFLVGKDGFIYSKFKESHFGAFDTTIAENLPPGFHDALKQKLRTYSTAVNSFLNSK